MKIQTIITVLVMISGFASAQVGLTEPLDSIKAKYPGGEVSKTENGYDCYHVKSRELESELVFGLDTDMNCFVCAVKPDSKAVYKDWIGQIRKSWRKTEKNTWTFIRVDGMVMNCEAISDPTSGDLLLFYLKQ